MSRQKSDPHVEEALRSIQGFHSRGDSGKKRGWRLSIPAWRLTVECLGMFCVAFLAGQGLGVLFRVLFNIG